MFCAELSGGGFFAVYTYMMIESNFLNDGAARQLNQRVVVMACSWRRQELSPFQYTPHNAQETQTKGEESEKGVKRERGRQGGRGRGFHVCICILEFAAQEGLFQVHLITALLHTNPKRIKAG